jgi:hypothetical protein
MSNARPVRYRRLALAEEDKAKPDLLLKLADECDRGILCTAAFDRRFFDLTTQFALE